MHPLECSFDRVLNWLFQRHLLSWLRVNLCLPRKDVRLYIVGSIRHTFRPLACINFSMPLIRHLRFMIAITRNLGFFRLGTPI